MLRTCHFGIVGDADTTHLVVTGGRHLSSATGSMATERKASTQSISLRQLKITNNDTSCSRSSKHGRFEESVH